MTSSVSWWLATARWTRKLASAAIAAVCCVSCINEYPADTEDLFRTRGVDLALQISLLEDADKEGETLPEVEKMHDLRVIITRMENGKEYVEYNRYIDFGTQREYRYGYLRDNRLVFRVTAPEKKHIYLFANSEPLFVFAGIEHVDPEHGNYGVRHPKPQGAAEKAPDEYEAMDASEYINQLRELTFTQDQLDGFVKDEKANGIPMSAEYDVTVTPGNTGISDFCVFEAWIVRACNKITFVYENQRLQYPIFVQDWALNNVASDAYLLPHVKGGGPLSGTDGEDIRNGSWIQWYADHIKSNTHTAELNYAVPKTTNYNQYNGRSDGKDTYADLSVTEVKPDGSETIFKENVTGLRVGNLSWNTGSEPIPGKKKDTKVYYFPETRYIPTDSDKQKYTMSFKTLEYNTSASGSEGTHWTVVGTYDSRPMESVPTLFRNTHVQIQATFMEGNQVDLNVSIINWGENDPVHGTLTPEN